MDGGRDWYYILRIGVSMFGLLSRFNRPVLKNSKRISGYLTETLKTRESKGQSLGY